MIVCLGTTPALQRTMIFERLSLDAVNRAADVRVSASGKPINVVRVLHTLGEPAVVTGFLGGITGTIIRADLDEVGITHGFIDVTPATRTCVTVIDRFENTATELVEEPAPPEDAAWGALLEALRSMLVNASVLVLSGSLAPGASDDFYARCVALANDAGAKSIVDARGEPLKLALDQRPFVVKPNRGELAATLGMDVETDAQLKNAMRLLIDAGPTWAIVTMGGDGAMVSDGRTFWRIRVPNVEIVSPIGSGDALAGGLAAGISRGQTVPEACKLATAVSVANAMTPGAGFIRIEDVQRLLGQISITEER